MRHLRAQGPRPSGTLKTVTSDGGDDDEDEDDDDDNGNDKDNGHCPDFLLLVTFDILGMANGMMGIGKYSRIAIPILKCIVSVL